MIEQPNKNIENNSTGPGFESWSIPTSSPWPEVSRQALEEKDPKARALLELKSEISNELLELKNEEKIFHDDLVGYKKDLKRTDNILMLITVAFFIAFITTLSLFFFDLIKEKDIYLCYNDLYQKYSEKNNALSNKINNDKIDINNLRNEINILRAKNSYLK